MHDRENARWQENYFDLYVLELFLVRAAAQADPLWRRWFLD